MITLLWFFYLFIFFIGLAVGSFLNVVIYRYKTGESVVRPPSRCPSCGQRLAVRDLVPLFSFLLLRGRCRYCRVSLSPRYPLVELLSGAVFLLCFHYFFLSPAFFKYTVIFCGLLVISGIDLEHQLIPNRMVLILFGWALLWQLFYPAVPLGSALLGMVTGGGLLFAVLLVSRGGMGGGDVKLMAVLGLLVGWPYVLVVLMLSFITGGLVGIALLLRGRKTRKSPLPFGPFLSLAFFVAVFWGRQLWDWYTGYL